MADGCQLILVYRVRSLSIVVQDVDVLSEFELDDQQRTDLEKIAVSCRNILIDLEKALNKYGELESSCGNLSTKVRRVWKRLKWEPEDIFELRGRTISNITLLNAYLGRASRYLPISPF